MLEKLLSNKKASLIVLVVVIIFLFIILSGRSPKNTAIDFLEALHKCDAKEMVSLMSDDLVDELMSTRNSKTEKALIKDLENILEEDIDDLKGHYGDKWKYDINYVDSYTEDDYSIVILEVV